MTPFQIVYNRQAVLPVELQHNQTFMDQDTFDSDQSITSKIDIMTAIRDSMIAKVASNIKAAQTIQKKHYDRKHQSQEFNAGDQVLLKNPVR